MFPTAGERETELADDLMQLSWGAIDLVFERAGLTWAQIDVEYNKHMILYRQLKGRSQDELDRLEQTLSAFDPATSDVDLPALSLFISHPSEMRVLAGELKADLARYLVDGFVAHDSIEFDQAWQQVIVQHLSTCEALIAIVTPDFASSPWCDQEIGWVLGRGVPVMSINAGKAPYGFFGVRQALPYRGDVTQTASAIVDRLLELPDTGPGMTRRLVSALEAASTYDTASALIRQLGRAQHWSPQLVRRAGRAIEVNDQIRDCDFGRGRTRLQSTLAAVAD